MPHDRFHGAGAAVSDACDVIISWGVTYTISLDILYLGVQKDNIIL